MDLSDRELLERINMDRALGLSVLFAAPGQKKLGAFHVEMIDAWRSSDEFVLIEAFRGGAKTTIARRFLCLEGEFGNFQYCALIGETYEKAVQSLDAIKHQMTSNSGLRRLFGGKVKGGVWRENIIELPRGNLIQIGGWDQEFRGFNYRDWRPDRLYLDDVENKTLVRDTQTVDAQWGRLWSEFIPALDPELRKVRMTGTPLATDCMVIRAKADPSFVALSYPICDGEIDGEGTKSLWPDRWPMEKIRAERDRFARAGKLREFLQEYMLVSAQTQGKPFSEEDFVFQEVSPVGYLPKKAIYDPARTVSVQTSAQTGKVVASRMGTRFYIHESAGEFWKPSELLTDAFDTSDRHEGAEVCIEQDSLEEWLAEPIRAEQIRRGRAVPFRKLRAPKDINKNEYITGLQPFFRAKDIVFVGGREKHAALVQQVLNFPAGRVDVLNALAHIQRAFAGEPVYQDFGEANIDAGLEPTDKAQLVLAVHELQGIVGCVLLAVEGLPITVLADWVSTLSANEAVKDAVMLARAVFPGRRMRAVVPGDLYDQVERSAVMRALKAERVTALRGAYSGSVRGVLSQYIRTEVRGRRQLLVDRQAKTVLHGLAGSYCFAVGRDGRTTGQPENGVYRVVCEALECVVDCLSRMEDEGLPGAAHLSTNPQGVQYMTSMPGRK